MKMKTGVLIYGLNFAKLDAQGSLFALERQVKNVSEI